MAEPCRDWRDDLALSAVGQLPAERTAALGAHLDACRTCRETLAELSGTAEVLRAVDPASLDSWAEPPAHLMAQVFDAVRFERRGRRRHTRRVRTLVAVAAAVIITFGSVVAVNWSIGASTGGDETVALASPRPGVSAKAELVGRDWGTEVHLAVSGLDSTDSYWLWLSKSDGTRVAAGTFTGRASGSVVLSSALPIEQTARVWVTDADDAVVLDAFVT